MSGFPKLAPIARITVPCPACFNGRLTRSASTPHALVCVQCGRAVERPWPSRRSTQGHLLMGGLMGLTLVLGMGLTLVDASRNGWSAGSREAPPTTESSPEAAP